MTTEQYITQSKMLNDMVDIAQRSLNTIVKGNRNSVGLVSDECKKSESYKIAKRSFDIAFQNLREFASKVPNKVKREAAMIERMNKMRGSGSIPSRLDAEV